MVDIFFDPSSFMGIIIVKFDSNHESGVDKVMKKYFWILIFACISQLYAKVLDVSYAVDFGMFGQMGVCDAHLKSTDTAYTIDIGVKATGIAKVLSRNRQERHTSQGSLHNGMFRFKTYKVVKTYGEKYIEKRYRADSKHKKVTKYVLKKRGGQISAEKEQVLDFYTPNDLLTLYFNLPKLIEDMSKPGKYTFKAAGAERQKGLVEVIIPKREILSRYEKILGKGDYWYMTVIIHQKIFASNRGELMLAIGKDGIVEKAVLKDLVMFGDLVAKRIK